MRNIKLITAILSLFVATGCTQTATTVIASTVGSTLALKHPIAAPNNQYSQLGENWKFNTTSILNGPSSLENIKNALSQNDALEFNLENGTFKPFSFISHAREYHLPFDNNQARYIGNYIVINTDMAQPVLENVAQQAKLTKSVIIINNLFEENIESSLKQFKVFHDKGVKVVLSPEFIRKSQPKLIPTLIAAQIELDGNFGCSKLDGDKCKIFDGTSGVLSSAQFEKYRQNVMKFTYQDNLKRVENIKDSNRKSFIINKAMIFN